MCGNLPGTLALFAVLGLVGPPTIKPFLPSRRHSREKKYQALSRFSILEGTESWVGSGNEASYFSGVHEEVVNMYQQMVLCSILMFSRSLLINIITKNFSLSQAVSNNWHKQQTD